MKVEMLIKLNPWDELRFYEESDFLDTYDIDEYTPYKRLNEISLNREVKFFSTTIEGSNGEYEDDWISVILKEENNA